MATLEGHHDFGVLERRLASIVRGAGGGVRPPVLVVAPSRRLLTHLQVRLATLCGGLLNVQFHHHDSLAREAAAAAGGDLPRLLAERVREALLRHLGSAAGGPLAGHLAARPGTAASLRRTFDDLREAGVPPDALPRRRERAEAAVPIAPLYSEYARHLQRLAGAGLADRAGLLRAALPQAREFARRFRLIVHYGAYELIGSNLELMRALEESGTPVVYLVPFHPVSPAYEYAARFWSEIHGGTPVTIADDAGDGPLLASRLPALYDEATRLPPLAVEPSAFHAQGAAAELREVALRILALHRDHGIPLREVAIVARSLEPYAADLRPVFEEHRLPFTTHARLGARREARVQGALQLARAGLRDFERQALMDLLRGGLLRLDGRDPSTEAHAWDRLSRAWRVRGGLTVWTRSLPAWVEDWTPPLPDGADEEERGRVLEMKDRRVRQSRALAAAVGTIARHMRPVARAGRWAAWSAAMRAACARLLSGFLPGGTGEEAPPDAAVGAVHEVLRQMEDLETAGLPYSGEAALDFFETGLSEATIRIECPPAGDVPPGGDNGGVRILDAMQVRGLSFEAVFLIGLNAGLFPRRAREDPFLPDDDRLALRASLRVPLPVGARGASEERLLLAHLLGGARRHLVLSWQRADAAGRARTPSLALREIARLTRGAPDLRLVVGSAARVASHPGEAALEARARHGLLSPARARLGLALQVPSPAALLAEVARLPGATSDDMEGLRAGLPMLAAIEEFSPGDLRFDACVAGAAPKTEIWSPSRLEDLGSCPQRYFFRRVLGIDVLDEIQEGYELEPVEMGRRVHAVLRDLYGMAAAQREVRPATARLLLEALPSVWGRHTADLGRRLAAEYPVFWSATEERWLTALRRFLGEDVVVLAEGTARVLAVEKEVRTRLDLGRGMSIDLRGRFDRVVGRAGGSIVVSDYKTSGSLDRLGGMLEPLKGRRLQMPLYVLLAGSEAAPWHAEAASIEAEILGVGPDAAADGDGGEGRMPRVPFDASALRATRDGLLETLRVLVDLAATGSFPLHSDVWCRSCPFTRACRRNHAPTVARLAAAEGLRSYFALRDKTTRKPLLADGASAGGGEETS